MSLTAERPSNYDPEKDKIEIVEYDPLWPQMYLKEAEGLRDALGRFPGFKIEHIGSTSVPGLAAKPVIDIMVYVETWQCWPAMAIDVKGLGYLLDKQDDMRMFLIKWHSIAIKRLFHLHFYDSKSFWWNKDLAFRNHLRANPDDTKKYEALKRELVTKFPNDREAYTQAKKDFILGILKKIGFE